MNLFLLGVFIALALVVLGKNVPQLAGGLRWIVGVLVLFGKVYGTIPGGVHLVNPALTMALMSARQ